MPIVGPDYFNLGFTNSGNWLSAQNIEGAIDGASAQSNHVGPTDLLYGWNWLGSVPKGYFWDFPNFVIEAYISAFSTVTAIFQTVLIIRSDGLERGGYSSTISVSLNNTMSWKVVSHTDWDLSGLGNLPTDAEVGIGIANTNYSSVGNLSIDSLRMTVSYNSADNFFNPPYGVNKNKRRFVSKRNNREKIIFEQMRPRMLRRKAA